MIMNELMITYGEPGIHASWAYFKTNQSTLSDAYKEYISALENTGVNADNLKPYSIVLRDPNEVEIDTRYFDKNLL